MLPACGPPPTLPVPRSLACAHTHARRPFGPGQALCVCPRGFGGRLISARRPCPASRRRVDPVRRSKGPRPVSALLSWECTPTSAPRPQSPRAMPRAPTAPCRQTPTAARISLSDKFARKRKPKISHFKYSTILPFWESANSRHAGAASMAALRSWDIKYLSEDGSVLLVGPFWDRRTCRRCIALCEEHGRWSNDPASRCGPGFRTSVCYARQARAGTQTAHRHPGEQSYRRIELRAQASGTHARARARSFAPRNLRTPRQVPVCHL